MAAGGVKIYEAALSGTATTDQQRKQWCTDLLAVRTADATKAFARLVRQTKGKKVFTAFAAQHRALMAARPTKPSSAKKPAKRAS